VRLHNVTGKAGLVQLRAGDVDFAVGPMFDTPPDIVFHPLVTYEPMLITRLDHPLAGQKRVTLKEIAKFPLILPPKSLSTHSVVEAVFAEHQLDHDVKLEVGGYDVIKKYVELCTACRSAATSPSARTGSYCVRAINCRLPPSDLSK
jgi:DNA-binding transcriptional LysR family regulator